jgi:hypothetical protein
MSGYKTNLYYHGNLILNQEPRGKTTRYVPMAREENTFKN